MVHLAWSDFGVILVHSIANFCVKTTRVINRYLLFINSWSWISHCIFRFNCFFVKYFPRIFFVHIISRIRLMRPNSKYSLTFSSTSIHAGCFDISTQKFAHQVVSFSVQVQSYRPNKPFFVRVHLHKVLAPRWLLPNADGLHRHVPPLSLAIQIIRRILTLVAARQKRISIYFVECIVLGGRTSHPHTHTHTLSPAMVREKFSWKFFSLNLLWLRLWLLFYFCSCNCSLLTQKRAHNVRHRVGVWRATHAVCVCVSTWEPFGSAKYLTLSLRQCNTSIFVPTFHYSQWKRQHAWINTNKKRQCQSTLVTAPVNARRKGKKRTSNWI